MIIGLAAALVATAAGAQPGDQAGPSDQRLQTLVAQLGADEFAVRERAATELMALGESAAAQIRQLAEQTGDAEVQLRAGEIVRRLSAGDQAEQVRRFLAGNDVEFPGWRVARAVLGDSRGIRELFVEMMRDHGEVLASLEQAPRDRALAMDKAVARVQDKMFRLRQSPTQADTFAVLMLVIDPNVPITPEYERVLMSLLHKQPAAKINQDALLSFPFKSLLSRWIPRSTPDNRESVLWMTMQWDLEEGLPLAVRTLERSDQIENLAIAMQVVARFGGVEHVDAVVPLLDDDRAVAQRGFVGGQEVVGLLGDVAIAAIAKLYGQKLTSFGLAAEAEHPTFAFLVPQIGFPANDPAARQAARLKIDELLKSKSEVR